MSPLAAYMRCVSNDAFAKVTRLLTEVGFAASPSSAETLSIVRAVLCPFLLSILIDLVQSL